MVFFERQTAYELVDRLWIMTALRASLDATTAVHVVELHEMLNGAIRFPSFLCVVDEVISLREAAIEKVATATRINPMTQTSLIFPMFPLS